MVLSRYLDEKQLILLKQGKGFFHIGGSGHEAAGLAAALSFKPGFDYAYPYNRAQAFCLGSPRNKIELKLLYRIYLPFLLALEN